MAHKHEVSYRNLAVSSFNQDMSLDVCTVSVKSTNQKRQKTRTSIATKIEANQQNIASSKNYFVLHWDGKMLKGLCHSDKKKEHIAIILKPLEN